MFSFGGGGTKLISPADMARSKALAAEQAARDKAAYDLAHPPFDANFTNTQITTAMAPLSNLLNTLNSQFSAQQQFNQDQAKAAQAAQDAQAENAPNQQNTTLNPFAPNVSNTSPMNPFAHHLNQGWGAAAGVGGPMQQGAPMTSFQPTGQQPQSMAGAPAMPAAGRLF